MPIKKALSERLVYHPKTQSVSVRLILLVRSRQSSVLSVALVFAARVHVRLLLKGVLELTKYIEPSVQE
jgi:hypothetical protein